MQIKTVMRYHFTLTRMGRIKKKRMWWRDGEIGSFIQCWWERKMAQTLWKTTCRLLEMLNIELSYDPASPVLGAYPGEMKAQAHIKTWIWIFTSALVRTARTWKWPKYSSVKEWRSEMRCMNTTEHYPTIKRNGGLTDATTGTNPEIMMLSERRQSQKTTCWMTSCTWNVQNRQNHTDRR